MTSMPSWIDSCPSRSIMKPLYKSKTFWFNVAAVAVQVSQVAPLSPEAAAAVVGIGNVVLRLLTTQPVTV